MAGSPTDAVSRARELTQGRLFPFNFDKWLRLGFIAFLAGLGEGGASGFTGQLPGLPSNNGSSGGLDFDALLRQASEFVRDNLTLVLLGGGLAYVVAFAFWSLILWVKSRADVIFVESVIHDRSAVSEPWTRLRVPGTQLFKTRFAVALVTSTLATLFAALGAWFAWPELRSAQYLAALLRFLPFMGGILLVAVPAGVFLAVLRDFLLPIMYLDGTGVSAAWKTFRADVLAGNLGAIVVFYVIKMVLGFGAAFITLLVTCLTCCLAALPYVGTVVLLPIPVFFRAYSLAMLEELGRPVFPTAEPPQPFKGWF